MTELMDLIDQMRQLNRGLKAQYGGKGICTIAVTPSTKNPSSFVLVLPQLGNRKQERIPLMKKGHNAGYSLTGLHTAYGFASEVCAKLRDRSFTREWMEQLLDARTEDSRKTTGQWVDEYMEHWWKKPVKKDRKQVKKDKKDQRCVNAAGFLVETFSVLPQGKPFSKGAIEVALSQFPDNQTGQKKVEALSRLLEFAGIYEYKALLSRKREQAIAGIEERPKYVPTDQELIEAYQNAFSLETRDGRKKGGVHLQGTLRHRWLFGLLATYGIRIHEAWMVMNWNNPIAIKAGEFIEIDADTGDEEYAIATSKSNQNQVIPAFFALGNKQPLLVIKGGKTGKRIAMPLSPKGQDWVELFGLRRPEKAYLPSIERPLELIRVTGSSQHRASHAVCEYFWRSIRWDLVDCPRFTAHKLRHAYTHRGRLMGINHQTLALSQGHLPSTADMVYARHFAEERTLEAIQLAQEQLTNSREQHQFPALEVAIAHASAIASANPDNSLEALARFASFMYGTPVTLP